VDKKFTLNAGVGLGLFFYFDDFFTTYKKSDTPRTNEKLRTHMGNDDHLNPNNP
jgi:hypothetical protein